MLVFGGNTHNDTSMSHGAKCFSSDFMAYDIGEFLQKQSESPKPLAVPGSCPQFGSGRWLMVGALSQLLQSGGAPGLAAEFQAREGQ